MEENSTNITELFKKVGAQTLLLQWFEEQGRTLTQLNDWTFMFDWKTDEGNTELLGIEASDYHNLVELYNYGWHEVSIWDAEAVEELKDKINIFNQCSTFKYVYRLEDDDSIQVGMKIHFPLCEEIPDMQKYLKKQFDDFVNYLDYFNSYGIPCHDILDFTLPKSNLDMVLDSLEKIQCEPKIKDLGYSRFVVKFEFQAEMFEFYIETWKKAVNLYDRGVYWYRREETDKHEVVREVINNINDFSTVTLYYEEIGDRVYVRSRFLLHCVEERVFWVMLGEILLEFFDVRYRFYRMLAKESKI